MDVSPRFSIEIDWERLEHGPPEERATFGAIGLRVGETWLTEAHDAFVRRVRQKVHLSGYQLAQWLAWNWWRLRWETTHQSLDWRMAHRLTTIGGGYVWPNVDCSTDGERVLVRAAPTSSRAAEPLRYVAEVSEGLPVSEFEAGVDQFIELVAEQLRCEGISDSNLQRIWVQLQEERADPEAEWYRRLEAAMGFDPDEAGEQMVVALIAEGEALGLNAVAELAAGASRDAPAPSFRELRELASTMGYEARLADIPQIPAKARDSNGESKPAWIVGGAAAQALRNQERLGGGPLSDTKLAELAGIEPAVVTGEAADAPFSFALKDGVAATKVVLQPSIVTGRRFALARLIGDRVLEALDEALIPIMRSHSYRQKVQRAFAAELLCPFETARQQLDDDFSEESRERIANEYRVSPMLVSTQLVNHGLLRRRILDSF